MLSVTLSWLPVAPDSDEADRRAVDGDGVAGAQNWCAIESVAARDPTSAVAPVIGARIAAWLLATLPVAVLVGVEEIVAGRQWRMPPPARCWRAFAIAVFSAALRLVAVAAVGGRCIDRKAAGRRRRRAGGGQVDLLGRAVRQLELQADGLSPLFGLAPPRSTESAAGEPLGPVTVAPVSVEETALIFSPNGDAGDILGHLHRASASAA